MHSSSYFLWIFLVFLDQKYDFFLPNWKVSVGRKIRKTEKFWLCLIALTKKNLNLSKKKVSKSKFPT